MNEKDTKTTFEGWAVIELFGHNQIAGYVTDAPQFGTSMMRVDVPEVGDGPGYTKFFGGSAIYAITPTTKEIAQIAAARLDVRPISEWTVPYQPRLSEGGLSPPPSEDEDYQDEDYQDEDYQDEDEE